MNRLQLFDVCRKFLGGTWQSLDLNQFHFQPITGGLSNLLYLCSLPDYLPLESSEPRKVIVRKHLRIHNKQMEENVIFTVLSEREIGPKLHGVFEGGRIEQYLPANPLNRHDLWKPNISAMVASEMAVLHNTNMPIEKKPDWLVDTMQSWLIAVMKNLNVDSIKKEEERELVKRMFQEFPFDRELAYVAEILSKIKTPIVFCHNDLQENNILVPQNYSHLMFIDYEYASYNYRTFDIAHHFCEWTFDYDVQKSPNFQYLPEHYPKPEEQKLFINTYLDTMKKMGAISERDAEIEAIGIVEELPTFTMAVNLFWALWGIIQAEISTIEFGYAQYANAKLAIYNECKSKRASDGWKKTTESK